MSQTAKAPRLLISALVIGALVLSLAAALICARADLGRNNSWSFPIDDAYIYSNYALAADQGHWFEYNPGEKSGGVTGVGWLVLLRLAYPLTGFFQQGVAGWAPQAVQSAAPQLAGVAGRLYLAAFGLGALLFAAAGMAIGWLAYLIYSPLAPETGGRARRSIGLAGFAALLAAVLFMADRQAIWGSFSGLELPFSFALTPLALATLLRDARRGHLRWSLVCAAALPWARPELAVFAATGVLWLLLVGPRDFVSRLRSAAIYGAAALLGLGALLLTLQVFTGHPLPSSFYVKVGGLRFDRALDAFKEWQAAGHWQPFALFVLALLGGLLLLFAGRHRSWRDPAGAAAASLLALLSSAAFLLAMTLALSWFGQEDRYILPLHPIALVLAAGILPALGSLFSFQTTAQLRRAFSLAGALLIALGIVWHLLDLRVWSASTYALMSQNIEQAHVVPALWLAQNSPPNAVLAAEPIGAIRLFSGRNTVDIVGLTTPAALGKYENWPATEQLLRARGAQFLLYYPVWWPDSQPLAWAREVQRYTITDNIIAGADEIAVYKLLQ